MSPSRHHSYARKAVFCSPARSPGKLGPTRLPMGRSGYSLVQSILMSMFLILTVIAGCNALTGGGEEGQKDGVISASGRIEGDEFNAGAKCSGKVDKVLVREGDLVKKGALLGSIYSAQLEAQVQSAEQEIEICQNKVVQAETSLEQARADSIARVNQSLASLGVSRSQLMKAESLRRQSLAQLDRAKIEVTQAKIEHEQARSSVRKAKAGLDYNEKEFRRHKNLLAEDAVPRMKFESVQAQYLAVREEYNLAVKQVDRAAAAVEVSKKNLAVAQSNVDLAVAGLREGQSAIEASQAGVNLAKVSRFEVELRQKEISNAKRALEKSRRALDVARADLEDSRVYAPIDGSIIRRVVEPGEVVGSGTPLITMVDMDALYLRVYLPTELSGKLRIGNPVKIVPDSYQKEEAQGTVFLISDRNEFTPKNVETKSQRAKLVFAVKIRVKNNKERKLKPGMPSEAFIDTTRVELSSEPQPPTTGGLVR